MAIRHTVYVGVTRAKHLLSGSAYISGIDMSETQLGWIMGCLLLFGLVIGYPSIMTALALLREERVLGRLYWHLRHALDRRPRDQ